MSLVFDRRDELADQPGTHALLVGISAYPHLSGGTKEPSRFGIDLRQLTSPARTAHAIKSWLVDHADRLVPPLATCRLLLAPSPGELPDDVSESLTADQLPTLNNLLLAASEWRNDAGSHSDGMAFFYVAGHGFALGRIDQIVLLHDYGDGLGSILRNSVNIESVWQGMASTDQFPDMARKQLFFVDSGQTTLSLPEEVQASRPTDVFDAPLGSSRDRAAITFFAAAPGQHALGRKGGLTVFGEALLAALEGRAAQSVDGTWAVTTRGMTAAIPSEVARIGREFGLDQTVTVGGLVRDVVVARLDAPPVIDVRIEVPAAAQADTRLSILDSSFETIVTLDAPLPENPVKLQLAAGFYLVQATRPDREAVRQMVSVEPPSLELSMHLE